MTSSLTVGETDGAEKFLCEGDEGGSDLDLSEEENDQDEYWAVIGGDGEESDEGTDRKVAHPSWDKEKAHGKFCSGSN